MKITEDFCETHLLSFF